MRTREQIQEDINKTEVVRERFSRLAMEEEDRDYRKGLYNNVDICNDRISSLLRELRKLE